MTITSIESVVRKQLLSSAIPFQQLIDKVSKPDPKITDEQYIALKNNLQDGTIFLAHDDWVMTNLFIPGFWKHAAIYCDGYVYEAVGAGCRKIIVDRWILQKDNICQGHVPFTIDPVKLKWFLEQQNGKPYNYLFDIDSLNCQLTNQKAWYCAELVYGALKYASDPAAFTIQLQTIMGDLTIPPQGLREQMGTNLILDALAINSTTAAV